MPSRTELVTSPEPGYQLFRSGRRCQSLWLIELDSSITVKVPAEDPGTTMALRGQEGPGTLLALPPHPGPTLGSPLQAALWQRRKQSRPRPQKAGSQSNPAGLCSSGSEGVGQEKAQDHVCFTDLAHFRGLEIQSGRMTVGCPCWEGRGQS